MFIIIQVPFIDSRLLKNEKYEDCIFPNEWKESPFYYRYFGSKDYRDIDYEQSFFRTKKKLFTSLICNNINIKSKIIYTRLFNDNFFFHLDIAIDIPCIGNNIKPLPDINYIINNGKLYAPSFDNKLLPFNQRKIQQCIADLYLYATTKKAKGYSRPSPNKGDLCFGMPAILLQCESHEEIKDAKIVNKINNDITVYKTMLKSQLYPAHLWILKNDNHSGPTRDLLRKYRICLLRMHNYREGLKNFFDFKKKYPVNPDVIKEQFAYLLRLLKRENLYGIDRKRIMDYAIENEEDIFGETWERLIINLEGYYNEIKGGRAMAINITQTGGNNNNTIQIGTGNTINNGIDPAQLKALIEAVKSSIPKNTPNEDVKTVKDKLEELNKQLNQPKRDKSIIESTLNSIKAVITTADFVNAVTTLEQHISSFL